MKEDNRKDHHAPELSPEVVAIQKLREMRKRMQPLEMENEILKKLPRS